MPLETILPGTPEIYDDNEKDPVIADLIELRRQILVDGDAQAAIEELTQYRQLRDAAEGGADEDRLVWKELNHKYGKLSDDQIEELIHDLESNENGDYINQ